MNVIPDIYSVSIGACGDNGAMGSSLTELIYVKKGSVELDFPELEETGVWDGKSDDPFEIIRNHPETLKSIKFVTTANIVSNMQLAGGTARSGGGLDYTILSDTTNYKSVQLITNAFQGEQMYIDIRRGSLQIRPTGTFTRAGELLVEVMITVASPRDASDEPLVPVEIYAQAASGRVATPIISQDGNDVTITCSTDGATIKYTINGLDPAEYGATYSSAVTITGNVLVRAYATKDGVLDSHYAQAVAEYSA